MNRFYKIININLTSVGTDEEISDVPCGTCTKCCEILAPYLTPEEVNSGLYPISLTQPTDTMAIENPDVGPIVTMFKNKTGGCSMFINNRCSIYKDRPLSCRQFDCRKGHHPKVVGMLDK
jgi:uncharacterized protein